jgi:ABC-type uncharacterized transport system auxiliary subunit
MIRLFILCLLLSFLVACSSNRSIPEDQYYRLPSPMTELSDLDLIRGGIFVQRFIADGLYRERPLLYIKGSQGIEVAQYDYQLWIDTPSRLLRDHLITYLRKVQASDFVVDSTDVDSVLRIHGKLQRFESDPDNGQIIVQMQFRVDHKDSESPVLLNEYSVNVSINGSGFDSIVLGYANAIDSIYFNMLSELSDILKNRVSS